MKKHAYLIIAHHNWWQLEKLLSLLDDDRNDIFLHIDLKAQDFEKTRFETCCKFSRVFIYRDVSVAWAGFSQIQCELSLFQHAIEEAEKTGGYDFYHLISGADLPLKSQDEIHDFFDHHPGQNFIEFNDDYVQTDECLGRMKYYFLAYDLKCKKVKKSLIYLDKGLRVFQRILHVDRLKKFPRRVYMGSNWVSLQGAAVQILLKNREFIETYFKWTSSGDELYKHTLLRESGISIYSLEKDHVKSNLRYIDFLENKPNPKTLTMEDYPNIMNSGALFARKFDEAVDKEIIERICEKIRKSS